MVRSLGELAGEVERRKGPGESKKDRRSSKERESIFSSPRTKVESDVLGGKGGRTWSQITGKYSRALLET